MRPSLISPSQTWSSLMWPSMILMFKAEPSLVWSSLMERAGQGVQGPEVPRGEPSLITDAVVAGVVIAG
jgi:hypothetical protein